MDAQFKNLKILKMRKKNIIKSQIEPQFKFEIEDGREAQKPSYIYVCIMFNVCYV